MHLSDFQAWRQANLFLEPYLFYPEGKDSKWGRLDITWTEIKTTDKHLDHFYSFAVNLSSGHLYIDCSKKKIWVKCCSLSISYPLYGCIKIAYHLIHCLPITKIFLCIYEKIRKQDSVPYLFNQHVNEMKHHAIEALRTPFYVVALTIASVASAIIGIVAPLKIYDQRTLIESIDLALNRYDQEWILARCFQSLGTIQDLIERFQKHADENQDDLDWVQQMLDLSQASLDQSQKILNQNEELLDLKRRIYSMKSNTYTGKQASTSAIDNLECTKQLIECTKQLNLDIDKEKNNIINLNGKIADLKEKQQEINSQQQKFLFNDTDYSLEAPLKPFIHLASSIIKYQRKHRIIFNRGGLLLNENASYKSSFFHRN